MRYALLTTKIMILICNCLLLLLLCFDIIIIASKHWNWTSLKIVIKAIVIDKVLLYQMVILPVVAMWWFHQKEKKCKILSSLIQNSKVLTVILIDEAALYQTAIVPMVAMWWFRQKEKI